MDSPDDIQLKELEEKTGCGKEKLRVSGISGDKC